MSADANAECLPVILRPSKSLAPPRLSIWMFRFSTLRNGLKIGVPKFLNSGVILQMRLRDTLIQGEVRYCVQTDDGFSAGLYIQDCVERRRAKRSCVDIPATIGELQNDQPARILDKSRDCGPRTLNGPLGDASWASRWAVLGSLRKPGNGSARVGGAGRGRLDNSSISRQGDRVRRKQQPCRARSAWRRTKHDRRLR